MRLVHVTALIVLTTVASPVAQGAKFEVISIKPIQPGVAYPNFFVEGDKLRGNHVTARSAIAFAYNVNGRQIFGGPDWIYSERYSIDARADHRLAPKDAAGHLQESVAVMLRSLLADRFRLRVRQESREMPAYALVPARPGFTPDVKHLRPARISCDDFETRRLAATTDDEKSTVLRDCFEFSGRRIQVRGRAIKRLAEQLAGELDRAVIDETGLSGLVDADLTWGHCPMVPGAVTEVRRANERDCILEALEAQLGMKLEERKAMLPVIVIESIQRPTPN